MATSPATGLDSRVGMPNDGILLAEELLDLAERAQAYTNSAGVAIALRRGQDLVVRTSAGAAPEVGAVIPMSDAFIGDCLRSRRPLCCRDTDADNRVGATFRAMKIRSLIAIPVCEHRDAKGVMIVIAPLPNAFQPTHTAILMTLSDIIASKLAAREAIPDAQIAQPTLPPAMAAEPAKKTTLVQSARVAPPVASARVEAPVAPLATAVAATKAPELQSTFYEPARPAASEPIDFAAAPTKPTSSMVPPALLRIAPLPLAEEKNNRVEPDPGLLSPSEDPAGFSTERPVGQNGTTAARPVIINLKPVSPAAVTSAASAAHFDANAAIASWELPIVAKASRRSPIFGIAAAAAVLVIGAGFWMYAGTTKEVAPPPAPTPAPAAMTMPAASVIQTSSAPVLKTGSAVTAAVVEQPKAVKPPESKPAEAKPTEAKHQPATPVLEIAAAKPKPELEPEIAAPTLSLASNDAAVSTLSKLPVAVPKRPQAEVVPATLVSRVAPVYPPFAKQMGIHGTVSMHVSIAADGSVSGVRVVSGPGQLQGAAVTAVKQWRYSPAKLDGKAVESSAEVQINFLR